MSAAFMPDDEAWIDALAHAADADPDQDHLLDLLALTDETGARKQLKGLIEARDALRRVAMQDEVLAEVAAQPQDESDRARVLAWAIQAGVAPAARGAGSPRGELVRVSSTPASSGEPDNEVPSRSLWLRLLVITAAAAAVVMLIVRPFGDPPGEAGLAEREDVVLGDTEEDVRLQIERAPDGELRFAWDLELPAGGYVELSFFEVARDGSRGALLFGPRRVRGRAEWTPPADFPVLAADRWQWELVAFNGLGGTAGTYVLPSEETTEAAAD